MGEHRATVEWQRSGEFRADAHEKCVIANSVRTEVVVEPCLK